MPTPRAGPAALATFYSLPGIVSRAPIRLQDGLDELLPAFLPSVELLGGGVEINGDPWTLVRELRRNPICHVSCNGVESVFFDCFN